MRPDKIMLLALTCLALSGCASNHYSVGDRAAIGGVIGLGVGAATGSAPGAVAGAAIGMAVGAGTALVY